MRWWWACVVQAVRRDLQFRTQAIATVVTAVLDLGLSIIPVLVLTQHGGAASGWTGPLAVAVVGIHGIGAALLATFITSNLTKMDDYVVDGDLDLVLIRPIPSLVQTTLRWVQPAELWGVLTGGALLVGGLTAAGVRPGVVEMLMAAAWVVLGIVGFTAFWMNLSYLAFWFASAQPVSQIATQLLGAGRYPRAYLQRAARTVFSTLVPASLVGAVPVEALLGETGAIWLLVALAGVLLAGVLTAGHWTLALRRYESASS